jgi:hypothetical protein
MAQYNHHVIAWAVAEYKDATIEYRRLEAGMRHAVDMERQYRIAGRNAFHFGITMVFDDARRRRDRWEHMVNWWGNRVATAQRRVKRCFTMVNDAIYH